MDLSLTWKISRIAGIASVILYISFLSAAWYLAPVPYSPLENWLSDFGKSSLNPTGAVFYNTGMVLTGFLLFLFMPGFSSWLASRQKGRIVSLPILALGLLFSFCSIMAGFFSKDFGWLHTLWAGALFVFLGLFLLSSGLLLMHSKSRPLAYYGLAAGAVAMVFGLTFRTPILEWITVALAFGYVALASWRMPRE